MTYEELIIHIDGLILQTATRSQQEFANQIGVSLSYLNDVLHGRREPGEKILSAIGVRKVVSYEFLG